MNQLYDLTILVSEFPPDSGGIGAHAFHLGNEMHIQGLKVHVVAEWQKNHTENFKFDFSPVIRIKSRWRHILYRSFKMIRAAWNSQDVLISGKSVILIAPIIYFLNPGVHFHLVVHGSETKNYQKLFRIIFRFTLRRAKNIICVSEYTKNSLCQHYTKIPSPVVIPNFITAPDEISSFSKKPSPKSTLHFFTLGTVSHRKGQWRVIEIWNEILHLFPNACYHIIGRPGDAWEYCHHLVKSINLEHSVKFYGEVTENEKWKLMQEMDIHFLLSPETTEGAFEGFGISILEAALLGIPSIGNKNSGMVDAIQDHKTGILVNPLFSHEIIDGVQDILAHKDEYINNSIAWAKEHFAGEHVNKYIQLIHKSKK